jgi:hypothetical protein
VANGQSSPGGFGPSQPDGSSPVAILYDPVSRQHSFAQRSAGGELFLTYYGVGAWLTQNLGVEQIEKFGETFVPVAGSMTAFGSPWGAMHIAYLDSIGDVQVVWWSPGMAHWTIDNLSLDAGGAPKLHGNLVSHSTAWGGLDVTGTDANGNLVTMWWAPGLAHWQVEQLIAGSPPKLDPNTVTAWTTPWGGMNVLGLDAATGKLTVYWWAPGRPAWTAEVMQIDGAPTNLVLRPLLAGTSSAGGRQVIAATTADNHLVNLVIGPETANRWTYFDVTAG